MMTELQGPESGAARSIFAAQDPNQAAVAIARDFLRPAPENLQRRVASYGGGGGGSGSASSGSNSGGGTMPMGLFDMQEQPPQTFGERLRAGMRSGSLIDSLALAANSLRDRPDQNIAQIVQGRQERRDEKATANRTAAWLASQGREDLAQGVIGGWLDAKTAVATAMAPAPQAEVREVGGKLVSVNPDGTVNEIYAPEVQPEFRRATPEEAAAYGAQGGQFGPDGRFYPVDVPQGMTIESDGAGGFRVVQGPAGAGGAGKPPTETQLGVAGYLQRMTSSENTMRDLERRKNIVTIPLEKSIAMNTGVEGYVLNPEEQQLAQAQRDWVRAKLREESGAVIGDQEMAAEIRTYFPQPGEGPEVIAQKAESRRRAERQMQIGSGNAAGQAGELSPEYAKPIRAEDLSAAGIGTQGGTGSQPVVIDGVTIRKVN
jgi:hypothetical protein